MTVEEAVAKLDALDGSDTEGDHADADDIVLAFLGEDPRTEPILAAWKRLVERSGGFWYA